MRTVALLGTLDAPLAGSTVTIEGPAGFSDHDATGAVPPEPGPRTPPSVMYTMPVSVTVEEPAMEVEAGWKTVAEAETVETPAMLAAALWTDPPEEPSSSWPG